VDAVSFTVFPSIEISEGRSVRTLQGRFGSESVYSDDPVRVATGFARAGARWLHIVDLDEAKSGVPANRELVLQVVSRASCPVQAGGALRDADDVVEMLAAGANRAILGTGALEDRAALRRTCARFGERIAVALDVRSNGAHEDEWTVGTGHSLVEVMRFFEEAGASCFIYTDVGAGGSLNGPRLHAVQRVAEATALPVIASGGIGTLDDIRGVAWLRPVGVTGAIVGRALYDHKFSVGQANMVADDAAAGRSEPPLVER
jgi:phosphoribosylformimino-5-aminoimidazole carboxamide ribotide isomerase